MRNIANSTDRLAASVAPRGFGRRAVMPASPGITALVLCLHGETPKALLVSDCADQSKAVWVPKAMVTIEEPTSQRGILVATMSKAFAAQKNLHERFIDPTLFNEVTRAVLDRAIARAAEKRNSYRGHRSPHARHDSQNQFA